MTLVLVLHHSIRSWHYQKLHLLVASYLFYAAWNPPFVLLIMFSTVVDWLVAKRLFVASTIRSKRAWFLLSIISNLGLLAFFKYGNFLLENFVITINALGFAYHPPAIDIILPMGISFYTFQTLSYTIDVYRGKLKPDATFLDFAFFITFFPQLVAGPIVRASDFLPQCQTPRKASMDQFGWGLTLITFGIFSKVILSDNLLAPIANAGFANPSNLSVLDAWMTILAFSGQIFFDFSGYSTAAIGAALSLGFALPDNFKAPYMAFGFSDFWQRWHISLSTWLKDYLYIPLGGNRISAGRTYANLMFTMLVGGLWHGASWLFVIWGGLHGLYLVIEHYCRTTFAANWRLPNSDLFKLGLGVLTFLIVSMTWVFFRAQTLDNAINLFSSLFLLQDNNQPLPDFPVDKLPIAMLVILALLVWHWNMRHSNLENFFQRLPLAARCAILSYVLLTLIFSTGVDSHAFIYFQF